MKLNTNTPGVSLYKLDFELTERCNHNCIHCYNNLPGQDKAVKEKELSTQQIKDIIAEAIGLGCLVVRFTGGEPLLREDFEDIYVFTRKKGAKVLILTNATLVTSSLSKLFAKIPPLERIEISVYGMKKESYEAVTRTSGSFEKARQGMQLLSGHKVPFVVKGAYLPPNQAEVDEFSAWARTIPGMENTLPSMVFSLSLRCRRDDKQKNIQIRKMRIAPEEGLRFLINEDDEGKKTTKEFCTKFMGPAGDKVFTCGAGIESCTVDAYGNFYPCLMLKAPEVSYDLHKISLRQALAGFLDRRGNARSKNEAHLRRCAKCFLHGLCGQCPAKSWMENGTLDSPVEYLCENAHAHARKLGLLAQDEIGWQVEGWKSRISNLFSV